MITTLEPLPFSRPVLDACLGTLQTAYEANAPLIDPELGHDDASFRYLVYKTFRHLLPGNLRGLDIDVVSDSGAIVVREGSCSLRAYAIGRSENDNPWTSFPLNRHGAPAAAAQNAIQLELFAEVDGAVADWSPNATYILGHCGTFSTGLRAVHLCLPHGTPADETVRRWLWLRTLYRADADALPLVAQPLRPRPVVPIVVPERPTVVLRADSPSS